MFRSILVPLDGSDLSHHAVLPAGDIARRLGASLSLAVVHPWGPAEDAPFSGTRADRELRAEEEQYLRTMRERVARAFPLPLEPVLLRGDPAPALAAFAAERRVDLVVCTTRGRSALGRALRGGVSLQLAHSIPCPALFIKPGAEASATPDPDGFTRILVPLDGSPTAEAAIEPALALAAPRGAVLYLVRIVSPLRLGGRTLAARRHEASRYLNEVAARLDPRGVRVECRMATRSDVGAAIARLAEHWEVDLLAIATRERGEGERMLLGSVADRVVHLAGVPVLVCHGAVRRALPEVSGAAAAWPLVPLLPAPATG